MGHTKEPWRVDEIDYNSHQFYIRGSHDNGRPMTFGNGAVAHMPRSQLLPTEENARRIVACVNACSGIPTENLDGVSVFEQQQSFRRDYQEMKQQRDELLAALRKLTIRAENEIADPCDVPEIVYANAVLAKADLTQ